MHPGEVVALDLSAASLAYADEKLSRLLPSEASRVRSAHAHAHAHTWTWAWTCMFTGELELRVCMGIHAGAHAHLYR